MKTKSARGEIRTHAGLLPADLESAALDRSATRAWMWITPLIALLKQQSTQLVPKLDK